MKLQLAHFSEADLQPASQLYCNVFAGKPWNELWEPSWAQERLDWVFNKPSGFGCTLSLEGQLIGCLLGHVVPFKGRYDFEIVELFVSEQHQGLGLGKRLIEYAEAELEKRDVHVIYLLTAKETDVERFYKKQGYQRSKTLTVMVKRNSDESTENKTT